MKTGENSFVSVRLLNTRWSLLALGKAQMPLLNANGLQIGVHLDEHNGRPHSKFRWSGSLLDQGKVTQTKKKKNST